MPRPYKAPNKRIIQRAGNGRFRTTQLEDIGLGGCRTCGAIFTPDFSGLKPMIDPREFHRIRFYCPSCREIKP